jgi:hypothetical protein
MQCPSCRAENREGSNFCRYCAASFVDPRTDPPSGYIPTVPPRNEEAYRQHQPVFNQEAPPSPPARRVVAPRLCPRCSASSIQKGTIPVWAMVLAGVTFPIFCFFSLFFLLIKGPSRCLRCGLEFK